MVLTVDGCEQGADYLHAVEGALGLKRAHPQLQVPAAQAGHRQRHVLDHVGAREQVAHRPVLRSRHRRVWFRTAMLSKSQTMSQV
jgi:hypothetical protein